MRIKRFLVIGTLITAIVGLQLGAFWADLEAAKTKDVQLTILYTTDLYGDLRDFRCKRPGASGFVYKKAKRDFSNLLFQVNRIRKEVVQRQQLPPPLLFNTGDNLATGLAARFLLEFEGLAGVDFVADVFERFGYDLIGLGNHEFSVPTEKLSDFLMQARLKGLKFSAANLDKAPATHALKKYLNRDGAQETKHFIFNRGGVKVGVFHLVPNELQNKVSAATVKGVEFGDPSSTAGELVPKLRDELGVEVVIVLSHLEGGGKPGAAVRELARGTSGIDLIITNELRDKGNTTAISNFDLKGRGVHIVGGSKYGRMLGRIDLVVDKSAPAGKKLKSFRSSSIPLDDKLYDPELRRELIKWELSYCKRWGKPLGDGRMRTKEGMTRVQFMDYTLNLLRKKTQTEVAFINKGAIRPSPFPLRGYVTKDDLYRALPFTEGSTIEVLPISGSDLNSLLEGYWDVNKPNSYKALHFAGVENGPNGTTINGRAVDESGIYWVTTISYVAKQSSGWLSVDKKKRILIKYTDGTAPELRNMILHHFARNKYKALIKVAVPPKTKPPIDPETGEPKKGAKAPPVKPFVKNEIPYNGNFVNLADRIAWKFNSEGGLGFTSIFISPINIGTLYTQKDTLTGGFYQKFQINASVTLKFKAETRMHLWNNTLSGNYDLDQSSQWSSGPPAQKGADLFQENTDQVQFKTEYRFRYFEAMFPGKQMWYFTSPFVEALLETEITRGSRPDLDDKDNDKAFFEKGIATERFRHFEIRAKAGLSFKLSDLLGVRIGAAGRKEFALQYVKQSTTSAKVVRTEFNFGFTADYELQSWQFAKIGTSPISWESKAEYLFTRLIGDENKTGNIHDLVVENKISFALSGNLSIALGLKFYLHQGLFPTDPNDENSKLKPGPLAFRFDPTISLRGTWAKRGQSF